MLKHQRNPVPAVQRKGGQKARDPKERSGTRIKELKVGTTSGQYEKIKGTHGQLGFNIFDFLPITWAVFLNYQVRYCHLLG
jgi:hypothetical protein